ncbi:MAG: DUF1800 family protein [Verrucomicrobiota bacterium]
MNRQWAFITLAVATAVSTSPVRGDDALARAEAEFKKAQQEVQASYEKWDSHEMARSATREISRAVRKRAQDTLASYRSAEAALQQGNERKNAAEIGAAMRMVQERLEAMRAAASQLVADSTAGDQAARELIVAESSHRSIMQAMRAKERAMLELKVAAAARTSGNAAEMARRAVHECDALKLYEFQQWTRIHKATGDQIAEMTSDAGRIAKEIAAAEPDADRKKQLLDFAGQQARFKAEGDQLIARQDGEYDALTPRIYQARAAAMGGLTPLSPEKFDYAKARHLLVRAGFGGTPQEVEKLQQMGLYKAVDYLVDYYRQPAAPAAFDAVPPVEMDPFEARLENRFMSNQVAGARRSVDSGQLARLRQWWLKRAVESQRPLQEKLTVFWHGHFANQNSVVDNSYLMYRQNQLFREHAAGNFGSLLYGIVHDPAMIRYLDNNRNVKGDPNENLAREIMELFAMGVDQGYTEKDIVQAARALTGYTYDHHTGGFRFTYAKHDTAEKTIFGQTGQWTGDDVVRLILDQPATSQFIARKLFEYFAYIDPDSPTVDHLASVLQVRKYELNPMLKNLFLSEEFYSPRAMATQIKSPFQLVVGALRDLGVKEAGSYGAIDSAIQQMGQQLFEPPDVKGWRYGRAWISSNRLFTRYNSVADLIKSVPQTDKRRGVDVVALLERGGCPTGGEAVDYLAKACLMRPLPGAKRQELTAYLGELPPPAEWSKKRAELNDKLRGLLVLMLSTPEYQLM